MFREAGIVQVVVLPFDDWIASIPPQVFVREYLQRRLNVCHMVVGAIVDLGQNRQVAFQIFLH